MTPATRDWLAGLKEFSEAHRAPRPARRVPVPSGIAAALGAILGDHLAGQGAADVVSALSRHPGSAVVLTTTSEGFAAAERFAARLASADVARFAVATEAEYRGWCMPSPDEGHRLHVNVWNWVKAPVPEIRRGEFAAWPIAAGSDYWLHRHGIRDASAEVRRADLWAWDGVLARPVATGVDERARRLR